MALKVLHDPLAQDDTQRRRFKKEAEAAALLTHTNLVSVFESSEKDAKTAFISMEFVNGRTLSDVLRESGTLDLETFERIISQVCEGLFHAHAKGVIHRDLKPGNILCTESGTVKIADFGIARVLEHKFNEDTKLTATHSVVGSPAYMSPEQCLGEPLDFRSDIYSLGAVMYECLFGKTVFDGNNAIQMISKHLSHEAILPGTYRPTGPTPLEQVVMRCLEKDPQARYQSMGDVILALKHAFRSPSKALPKQYRWKQKGKRPSAVAMASIVLIPLLMLSIFLAQQGHDHPAQRQTATGSASTGSPSSELDSNLAAEPEVETQPDPGMSSGRVDYPRQTKDTVRDIAAWRKELDGTKPTDYKNIGRLCKSLSSNLFDMAYPNEKLFGLPRNKVRTDYLLSAISYGEQAERALLKVPHAAADLDQNYENLSACYFYLPNKEMECDVRRRRAENAIKSDSMELYSKVDAIAAYADDLLKTGKVKEAREIYLTGIKIDRTNADGANDRTYSGLIDSLAEEGKVKEALAYQNELIKRLTSRYGKGFNNEEFQLSRKARLESASK